MIESPKATARRVRLLIAAGLTFALVLLALPVFRSAVASHRRSPGVAARQLVTKPTAITRADFNGDGFADLAAGVPGESQADGVAAAGAVSVIYGSATGLTSTGNQLWSQDSTDVLDAPQKEDEFGFAVAPGDFNGDGFADLAIGVPYEDTNHEDSGAVNVLYGTPAGLSAAGNQFWTRDSDGIIGEERQDAEFGRALATGDFNRDGFADLAVGIPSHDVDNKIVDAGSVAIIYGSASGLTPEGNQALSQDSDGIRNSAEAGDQFGFALATGNFDHDGFIDLAVGAPGEDALSGPRDAGAVNVIFGSGAGLTGEGDEYWTQDSDGVKGQREAGDLFGYALASGDLDGDGFEDLAVGVPFEDLGTALDAGYVNVLYGSAGGLTSTGDQGWSQDSDGISSASETGDEFGFDLAAGNLTSDRFADLTIGSPGEDDSEGREDTGAAHVLFGGGSGLTSEGSQFWTQDIAGVEDQNEAGDRFGFSAMSANFGAGAEDDLALGVAFEDLPGGIDGGGVSVFYGSATGPSADTDQFWTQDSSAIQDTVEPGDQLGRAG
jgi:FG-GAP repeat